MGKTSRYSLPFPEDKDAPDGPAQIKALAEAVEAVLYAVGDYKFTHNGVAPSGWLKPEGQEVSRTTYAALFALLGTTFGAGNGTTTFHLPDWRGRPPIPLGTHADVNAVTDNDGLAVASRTPKHIHTMPNHTHTYSGQTGDPENGGIGDGAGGGLYGLATNVHDHHYSGTTSSAGAGNTGSSFGAYQATNWLIKT